MLTIYVIAHKYESDVFYDAREESSTTTFNAGLFFPTQEIAEEYIEDQLSNQYEVVPANIYRYDGAGLEWGLMDTPESWD